MVDRGQPDLVENWNYLWRLVFCASLGGLLFGYCTGVMTARLFVRDDTQSLLMDTVISMSGGIVGAALGGWMNDRIGRKASILIADVLISFGALLMPFASAESPLFVGMVVLWVGVGIASVTSPLYVSEVSPSKFRGRVGSINCLLSAIGHLFAHLVNFVFIDQALQTRTWMFVVVAVPAFIQFRLMSSLPESPIWLYMKDKKEEAVETLNRIYSSDEVADEVAALGLLVKTSIVGAEDCGNTVFSTIRTMWSISAVRRGLYIGIGLQVAQQLVGFNMIMYYIPDIMRMAGFRLKEDIHSRKSLAIFLLFFCAPLYILGSITSAIHVDRRGRRKLLRHCILASIVSLLGLAFMFAVTPVPLPTVSRFETIARFQNNTCSSYITALDTTTWDCVTCLEATSGCGFCADKGDMYKPGACLTDDAQSVQACQNENHTWINNACPRRKYSANFAVNLLATYVIAGSTGLGTVAWILNSEVYPVQLKGLCSGIAAIGYWFSGLVTSVSLLNSAKVVDPVNSMLLMGLTCCMIMWFVELFVPETARVSCLEVEKLLENSSILKFWKSEDSKDVNDIRQMLLPGDAQLSEV